MRVKLLNLLPPFIYLSLVLLPFTANAAKPVCKTTSSGAPLFQYSGPVTKVYVNAGNLILVYFDEPVTVEEAASCGLTITHGHAASFRLDEQPDFAKLFYSTALAAQASQRDVVIQMYGVTHGYLMFDRIWLAE